MVWNGRLIPEGDRVPGTSPLFAKLAYQLLPAVALAAVGVVTLGHLSRPVSAPPTAAPVEAAVDAEAVFTSTPRQPTEEPKPSVATRTVNKPKPVAASTTPTRKPEAAPTHQAEIGAPLSIVPSAEQTQVAAVEASDTSVMGKVRSIGTTVQQLPQRTYSTVTSWFSSSTQPASNAPPRPPADIPQNLKTAM